MTAEFTQRIRKEIALNLEAIRETVLAISERVNRKVHVLKLHGQASRILDQIESVHRELGAFLSSHLTRDRMLWERESTASEVDSRLIETGLRLQQLKKDLAHIEASIRELESEAMREDLLRIQQDLSTHAAAIERVQIVQGAPAIGRSVNQLELPPTTRVMAVFRGTALLAATAQVVFRAGDIVVLLGLRADLKSVVPSFNEKQRVSV